MNRFVALTVSILSCATLGACGGPAQPADKPDPTLAEAKPGPSSPPRAATGGGGTEGPVASSTSADVTKGTAAVKAGDWAAARAAFEAALRKNPKQADAHYYLGVVMDKSGDRAAAERSYRTALDLQPDLQEAAANLTAIYVESQKYDEAIAVARKSLAKNAKDPEMTLNLAVALSGKGEVDGATKAFDDAVRLAPNNALFFLAYAEHLGAAKKTDDAIAKLKLAQRAAGDDPALLGTVGYELKTLRAVPECISVFDKAIAISDNADFRTNRAQCRYAAKDKPGAMADIQAATTKEPGFAPAHYWLGSWLHEDGKFSEAAAEYDAYLKAAPKGPMAKAAEAKSKLAKDKRKPEKPAAPKK